MDATYITLHLNKLNSNYFSENEFAEQYKNSKGYLDEKKLKTHIDDLLLEDLEKIQNLLINTADIHSVLKYIQYISKTAKEIVNKYHFLAELVSKKVNHDIANISENANIGLKGFETDYRKLDAHIGMRIYCVISNKVESLGYDIQKLLDHYNTEPAYEATNAAIPNSDKNLVAEQTILNKEPEFIIPHPDAFIAMMRVCKERNIIITNDIRKSSPSNNKLAKFISSNFKLPANNESGYLKEGSIETYFSSKNDNEAFQKVYDKFYEAVKSTV